MGISSIIFSRFYDNLRKEFMFIQFNLAVFSIEATNTKKTG